MSSAAPSPAGAAQPNDFAFYAPAEVFEDLAKSQQKRHMRIGGPIGSECEDLAKEIVLQDGLNYDDFLGLRGFFNKNHSSDTLDILGAPESVKLYKAGETLPNGCVTKHATTWVEGFLYDTAKGRETYELAKAMQGSGKSLGFSIEGHVEQRSGHGNRTIAKARIQNVAITHVPCNPDARLEVLLRSVSALNAAGGQPLGKTMTVGHGALTVATDGHDVPMVDAKDPEGRADTKPTALPFTREQLDEYITAVVHPLLEQAISARLAKQLTAARAAVASQVRKDREAARQTQAARSKRLLKQAAEVAHKKVQKLGLKAPVAGKTRQVVHKTSFAPAAMAEKSICAPHLLQSIFTAMPGVSVAYAEGLAQTIQRNRTGS